MNDRLVWIDCEMTGLSITDDALVEVAALVTDYELNVLGDGVDVLIKPPPESIDQMVDVVRKMHTSSGLLTELENGGTIAEAIHREIARLAPESGVDWGAVEFFFGDERYVASDSADRNAGQARAAFLDAISAARWMPLRIRI